MKKQKFNMKTVIGFLFFVIICALTGVGLARTADIIVGENGSSSLRLLVILLELAVIAASFFIQTVIHEGGHLLFGLLSGYRFCSFRVFNIMLIKQGGTFKLKRHSVAGTAGQCLMAPPKNFDVNTPGTLLHLGGCILNLLSFFLFFILAVATGVITLFLQLPKQSIYISMIPLMIGLIGLGFAVLNGIPRKVAGMTNDGYNAMISRKNKEGQMALLLQLEISARMAEGQRLVEMPEEWFILPSAEAQKDPQVAAMAVICCDRAMEEHKFGEAREMIEHILAVEGSGLIGLHKGLISCNLLYIELIGENRAEEVERLYNIDVQNTFKTMPDNPMILRTRYAYALLHKKDAKEAEKILKDFEKREKNYPYVGDFRVEWTLAMIAKEKAQ